MTSLLTEDPDKARRAAKRHRRAWHVFAAVEFAAWRHRERVADGPGGVVRVTDPKRAHAVLFGRTMWTRSRTLAGAYSAAYLLRLSDERTMTQPQQHVPWADVPPGSAWIDEDGDVGLRWPTSRNGVDCGWTGPSWPHGDGHGPVGTVEIVAVRLSHADCNRIAATPVNDLRITLARSLAAKRGMQ